MTTFRAQFSRLRGRRLIIIFIASDFTSLVLQAGGGAIAVIANSYSFEYIGIHISMAGLALQVFSLVVVLCLAADFASRCWRNRKHLDEKYEVIRSSRYFHGFIYGVYCSPDVPWAPNPSEASS
jgi:hypothetical protein